MNLGYKNLPKINYIKYKLIVSLKFIKNFILYFAKNIFKIFSYQKHSIKRECLSKMKTFVANSEKN